MRKVASSVLAVMLILLVLATSASAAPPPKIIEVGENVACDYHSIGAAIAGANPGDTIKVQHKVFYESGLVVNKSLTIIGGYVKALYGDQACLGNTGTGRATVRPQGLYSGYLLRVQGGKSTVDWFIFENGVSAGVSVESGATLTLKNSIVRNNDDGGLSVVGATANLLDVAISGNDRNYGGGIYMNTGASVTANASLITGNSGWDQGAGVYLRGGSAFHALEGTRIESNRTVWDCEDGGGVAALGAGTEVVIDASQVLSNTALHNGGGLYIAGGAQAFIQNGSIVRYNNSFGPVTGLGGGAYVTGSTSALYVRNSAVADNWSDPYGGGIYNVDGTVHISGVWFLNNSTRNSGGGIYNTGGSVYCRNSLFIGNWVQVDHGGAIYSIGIADTLDTDYCLFGSNRTEGGDGGAVYAKHSFISVRRGYFSDNSASGNGSAIFLSAMDIPGSPTADVVNSYFVDNQTTAPVARDDTPVTSGIEGPAGRGSSLYAEHIDAYLVHNTFAHQTYDASFGVHVGPYSSIQMTNNIFTNFEVGIRRELTSTGSGTADHTLFFDNTVNKDSGVSSTNEVLGNPGFVGSGNYSLTTSSSAINAGTNAGVFIDFHGGSRPWGGGYDIGAEEYPRRQRVYLPVVIR